MAHHCDATYFPSWPFQTPRKARPDTRFVFDSGDLPDDAAALAANCDAAAFVTTHEMERYDVPNLRLPHGQDALVEAASNADRHTVVVLKTGHPGAMPGLGQVACLLGAWYPVQEGPAIADILIGASNIPQIYVTRTRQVQTDVRSAMRILRWRRASGRACSCKSSRGC